PAGSYGQAGLSADEKYFIVYDKYDVWALPINGDSKGAYSITNGYGRKNNIRFKVTKISKGTSRGRGRGKRSSNAVDLTQEITLESVNLDNMHSGYYRVSKGKDPVKLVEGPYKFSTTKHFENGNYLVRRESFNEAPDYWLANKDFKFIRRITSLNDQLKEFKTGDSKVISWNDNSGEKQTGILYTPEDYDSTKSYPTIVYFYETMSQDAFLFYDPAPTTSTINPIMFVSRGYVIFMPDIRYEIGWPGKSCLNIVESGTRHLIDKGVIDPNKLGLQGHSWGGYQVAYLITQTDLFTAACSETAVANMTSAYTGIRTGPGKPRMFMYESTQSRIGGTLWEKKRNYIENSPLFYLDQVTTPLLSRHSDGDEAVPYSQGLELFIALKRLGKEVWMFNYKGDGHNIKKRAISLDWTKRMDEYFDYYLMGAPKPKWMILE
ncbi:MAG: prolyl oligopeptidase family serine peptidase, partial [Bacteroidales bacterium]